jgi:hypothetical protein
MSSTLFETVNLLERANIYYTLQRTRPDTICISATLIGERLEIDVFEDGHLEISRFKGDERVEGGKELLESILNVM